MLRRCGRDPPGVCKFAILGWARLAAAVLAATAGEAVDASADTMPVATATDAIDAVDAPAPCLLGCFAPPAQTARLGLAMEVLVAVDSVARWALPARTTADVIVDQYAAAIPAGGGG